MDQVKLKTKVNTERGQRHAFPSAVGEDAHGILRRAGAWARPEADRRGSDSGLREDGSVAGRYGLGATPRPFLPGCGPKKKQNGANPAPCSG